MSASPYREPPRVELRRSRFLDPWLLALLFAWVGVAGQIVGGVVGRRAVGPEIGFAVLLAGITAVVVAVRAHARWRRRAAPPREL